ncbi:hypothetical protein [Robiginitalea marina]|uniref:Uncharacterized protein n=1 Tax=Robiginitalea marina TaxID=2954105 RepID=A0ABT1AUI6_9FLAO|nr:hypothetical protein [Robiginitalea marina]MCO5723267.1 hypothetical protein [Robiginitalea marina]
MKHLISAALFLIGFAPLSAQQEPENEVKVQIFTQEEKDNLQLWYHEGLQKMGLSEETEARYQSILTYYAVKMARLDDRDQEWTPEQFKGKLKEYLTKQESEIRKILTPEQYTMHEEIYGEFLRSVYRRWNIDP